MVYHDDYEEVSTNDNINAGFMNQMIWQMLPVGSVIAWLKSYTSTPSTLPGGWMECDGSTISDADSPINGVTVPDLNGNNYFLRGNSTSGGTGGSETADYDHNHNNTTSANWDSDTDGAITSTDATTTLDGQENRPPFYNVVWIMRFK